MENEVTIIFYVLDIFVEDIIVRNLNSTAIVTMKQGSKLLSNTHINKELPNP